MRKIHTFTTLVFMVLNWTLCRAQVPIVQLYTHPTISKQIATTPNVLHIQFDLQNDAGRPISRFELDYTLRASDPGLALLSASSSDQSIAVTSSTITGGLLIRFAVKPNNAWKAAQQVTLTADIRLTQSSKFTEEIAVTPKPFPEADKNYNQINDELEQEIAQRLQSGEPTASETVEIIVAVNHPTSQTDLQTFQNAGGTVKGVFAGGGFASFYGSIAAKNFQNYVNAATNSLSFIDPNLTVSLSLNLATANSRAANVWNGSEAGNNRPDVNFAYTGNPQTTVAFIDSGIDATHAAFGGSGPGAIPTGYLGELNFGGKIVGSEICSNTACAAAAPVDTEGHGSHVAGIISARANGANPPGVAGGGAAPAGGGAGPPGVGLVAIRPNPQTIAAAILALQWVRASRRPYHLVALNSSMGANGRTIPAWDQEMDITFQDGTPVAQAAGNDFSGFPGVGGLIGSPGLSRYAITVAAVDRNDQIATYSSQGDPTLAPVRPIKPDVAAPGGDIQNLRFVGRNPVANAAGHLVGQLGLEEIGGINSVRPNVLTPPPPAPPVPLPPPINQYAGMSGTSMAAPHVAGELGLVMDAITNYGPGAPDADPWNGIDDNHDDIIDDERAPWNQRGGADLPQADRQNNARLVKSIVLMTTWQVTQGALVPQWALIGLRPNPGGALPLPPEIIDDVNANGIKDAGEATIAAFHFSPAPNNDVIQDVNGNGTYDLGTDVVINLGVPPSTPNTTPIAPWVNPVGTAGFTPIFVNHGQRNAPPAGVARGGKDHVQGYGVVAADAAVEAVTKEFCAVEQDQFGPGLADKKVWARHVHLYKGKEYKALLDVPATGDYDLYVYYGNVQPDPIAHPTEARNWGFGEPIILASSTNAGNGVKEEVTFTVPDDGMYFLVVKWVAGNGLFTVRLITPEEWTVMVYMPAEHEGFNADTLAFKALNRMEETGSGEESMRHFQVLALVDYDTRSYDGTAVPGGNAAHPGDAVLYCVRKDKDLNHNVHSIAKQPAEFLTLANAGGANQRAEANMGDSNTVKGFASWVVDYFPAKKYAFIMWGDGVGFGWKANPDGALGPGNDTNQIAGGGPGSHNDALTMAKLRTSMQSVKRKINIGSQFKAGTGVAKNIDLLGLDMGHMALIEVGRQVQDSVDVMVASEERIAEPGWPYGEVLQALKCPMGGAPPCNATDPNWGADDFGKHIVAQYHNYYTNPAHPDPEHTLSAIRLNPKPQVVSGPPDCWNFDELVKCVSEFAGGIAAAGQEPHAGLYGGIVFGKNKHDEPKDNVQILIKHDGREKTEEMEDHNYIDLRHFAENIKAAPFSPLWKLHVDEIINALQVGKDIIVAEAHGTVHPNAHGMTIYFPHDETLPEKGCVEAPRLPRTCGFDSPFPARVVYAKDPFIKVPILNNPPNSPTHPRPQIDGLRFPQETLWDEFVHRYYKPVADACITALNGKKLENCPNVLSIKVGDTITLTGVGSSDSDGPDQDDLPDHIGGVEHWYWDMNPQVDNPAPIPIYPMTSNNVLDGGTCSEDCDRNNVDDTGDDPDVVGRTTTWTCSVPGSQQFLLHVWDDHHDLPRVHDEENHFVHYNVDTAYVQVNCDTYEITKEPFPRTVERGQTVTYTVTLKNMSSTNRNYGATDPLPKELSIGSASLKCNPGECRFNSSAHQLEWIVALAPGGTAEMSYSTGVSEQLPGTCTTEEVENQITVDDGAGNMQRSTASVEVSCTKTPPQ